MTERTRTNPLTNRDALNLSTSAGGRRKADAINIQEPFNRKEPIQHGQHH